MICASCGATPAPPSGACAACGSDVLLDGRYRLLGALGQGAFGTTWRAVRVADEHPVCLKELMYQRLASFEPERMFRREAEVLRQLDLPGVPRYIDDFAVATGRAVSLFIAQELVDGESLQAEAARRRYRESEVLAILTELCRVLGGLHELAPPVVHRDVKPANVMRRRADGRLVLVDFGSVKDVVRETIAGGPSIAGTIGFMAPEQLHGRATPASDVYAAGVLAVTLLSRREPGDLLDDQGRLDWAPHVVVSPLTADALARMLDPDPAARPRDGKQAAALVERALRALEAPAPEPVVSPATAPAPVLPRFAEAEPERDDPFVPGRPAPLQRAPSAGVQAEERSGWGPGLVLGALALAALGSVVVMSTSSSEAPALMELDKAGTSTPVPDGLLGLRLGMTMDEARAAVPEVAAGEVTGPEHVSDIGSVSVVSFAMASLPGERIAYRTSIVGTLASCHLDFAVERTLSKLSCSLDGFAELSTQSAAESAIIEQLRSRYGLLAGPGCVPRTTQSFGTTHERTCAWTGAEATLRFDSRFQSFDGPGIGLPPSSTVSISLISRAHDRVVEQTLARARREADAREAREKAEREAREAEERRRIEASGAGRPL